MVFDNVDFPEFPLTAPLMRQKLKEIDEWRNRATFAEAQCEFLLSRAVKAEHQVATNVGWQDRALNAEAELRKLWEIAAKATEIEEGKRVKNLVNKPIPKITLSEENVRELFKRLKFPEFYQDKFLEIAKDIALHFKD